MQSRALISGRVWSPNGSRPRFCKHQIPKANLSALVGAKDGAGMMVSLGFGLWLGAWGQGLTGGRRGRLGFLDRLEDGLHEGGQVVGLSAGNEVAVAHDLGIEVFGAGVTDVVLDGEETGGLAPLERLGGAQHPG